MKSGAGSFVVALTIVAIVCGAKSPTTESIRVAATTTTAAATTTTPTTKSPTTKVPTTKSPTTTTKVPTTKVPTTKSPTTTKVPTTKVPTTKSPTPTTTPTTTPLPIPPPFKLCKKDISDCTCRTNNHEMDLSPLANKEGDLPRFIRIRVDNSTAPLPNYAWNPCYPFEVSTDAVANACTVNKDVAVRIAVVLHA